MMGAFNAVTKVPGDRRPDEQLMAVLVALTVGLIWWVAAWAFGINSFDAFLLTEAMVVAAAATVIIKPFVDQMLRQGRSPAAEDRGAAL